MRASASAGRGASLDSARHATAYVTCPKMPPESRHGTLCERGRDIVHALPRSGFALVKKRGNVA